MQDERCLSLSPFNETRGGRVVLLLLLPLRNCSSLSSSSSSAAETCSSPHQESITCLTLTHTARERESRSDNCCCAGGCHCSLGGLLPLLSWVSSSLSFSTAAERGLLFVCVCVKTYCYFRGSLFYCAPPFAALVYTSTYSNLLSSSTELQIFRKGLLTSAKPLSLFLSLSPFFFYPVKYYY